GRRADPVASGVRLALSRRRNSAEGHRAAHSRSPTGVTSHGDRRMSLPHTPAVTRTLERAAQEARTLGHDPPGTEHAPLGMAGDEGGPAAAIFGRLQVELPRLRLAVGKSLTPIPEMIVGGTPAMTPALVRALNFADEEARAFGLDAIDTDLLLLGL